MDDRGNAAIGRHLRVNILPGYAVYKAIIDSGESEERAFAFFNEELGNGMSKMAKKTAWLSSKRYAYPLVRFILKTMLTVAYPKSGWTCKVVESSKEAFRFNISSCLYLEELRKRGAEKLCPAFCHTDVLTYSPLAPAVEFIRHNTLANTGKNCDFCFKRGK